MRRRRTSCAIRDDEIAFLDRGGIWELLWDMRFAKATFRSIRAVLRRGERLTGRKYYS